MAAGPAGLAGVDHLADDARVVGDAQFARLDAQCGAADEGVIGPVPEEDAGPIGAEQSRGGLGHLFEQRLHLAGFVPLAGDFQNRFQPADAGVLVLGAADRFQRAGQNRGQGFDRTQRVGTGTRQRAVQEQQLATRGMPDQRSRHPTAFDRRAFAIQHVGQQSDRQRPHMPQLGNGAPVARIAGNQGGEIGTGGLHHQRQGVAEKFVDAMLLARPPEQIGRDCRQFGMFLERLKAGGIGGLGGLSGHRCLNLAARRGVINWVPQSYATVIRLTTKWRDGWINKAARLAHDCLNRPHLARLGTGGWPLWFPYNRPGYTSDLMVPVVAGFAGSRASQPEERRCDDSIYSWVFCWA